MIIFRLAARLRLLLAVAVLLAGSRQSNGQQGFLDYDPATGNLALDVVSTTNGFTTFELRSRTRQFLLDSNTNALDGPFDVYRTDKLFKLDPRSFNDLDFAAILTADLPVQDLAGDLCVAGSSAGGGHINDVSVRSGGQLYAICDPNANPLPTPDQVIPPAPPKPTGPAQPFFIDFNPATGQLSVESPESIITTLEIRSGNSVFIGDGPDSLSGLFEVFSPSKVFWLRPKGFQTFELGNQIAIGTSPHALAGDLCYDGALIQGGRVGELYVRAAGAVHPVTCGPSRAKFDVATSVDLDSNVDIGIVVDPNGGNLIVHVPEDPTAASKPLTQLEISATKNVFLPGNKLQGVLDGPSDLLTENRLVKVDDLGFGTIDFGPILRNGEALGDLSSVLSVTATFAGGETVDAVQYVNLSVVPEPSSATMLLLCLPLFFVRSFRSEASQRDRHLACRPR